MSDFDPEYVFSHHSATPEKLAHYEAIHQAAKVFAQVILERVPNCADRDGVLHLLREASMLACSAYSDCWASGASFVAIIGITRSSPRPHAPKRSRGIGSRWTSPVRQRAADPAAENVVAIREAY